MKFKAILVLVLGVINIAFASDKIDFKKAVGLRKNLGFELKLGYNLYLRKSMDPYFYMKYIHPKTLCVEGTIEYKYNLNKDFSLEPFVGYFRFVDNIYNFTINKISRIAYSPGVYVGSFVEYERFILIPRFGVCGKRIFYRKYLSQIADNNYKLPMITKNFYQAGIGVTYPIKDFRIGLIYWHNISWLKPEVPIEFSYRECLFSVSWYPWKRLITSNKKK